MPCGYWDKENKYRSCPMRRQRKLTQEDSARIDALSDELRQIDRNFDLACQERPAQETEWQDWSKERTRILTERISIQYEPDECRCGRHNNMQQ